MAWGSTVPVVLPALTKSFQDAPGLEDVRVYDGAVLDGAQPLEWLRVGYDGEGGPAVVEGESTHEGLSTARNREQYTVQCAMTVVNGSTDAVASRDRLYQLFAAVGAFLAADPTLGRTVMQAQLGSWALGQKQTGQGAVSVLSFGIEVDAFTRV